MKISFHSARSKKLVWKVLRDFSAHYSPLWPRALFLVVACSYFYLAWHGQKSVYDKGLVVAGLLFLEEALFNFPLILRLKWYRARRYYRTRPGYSESVSYEMTDDFITISGEGGDSRQIPWDQVTKAEERKEYFYFVGGRVYLFSCFKEDMTEVQTGELRDWLVSRGKLRPAS